MRFFNLKIMILLLFSLAELVVSAQYHFTDASWKMGSPIKHINREYGNGVSFYDINGDGYDDITFPSFNDSLLILFSNGESFERIKPVYCDGESKMALWGDYDNDGDADLFLGFYEGQIKLYRNDGEFNFVDVTQEVGLDLPPKQTYGASWGDINGDGWLDLLVVNYNFPIACSWLLVNNQGVSFSEVGNEYGINVESGFSFQGTFFDINSDGRQDIHIANDKIPNDAVLLNQGSYFQNIANISGLNQYCESMSSSVADFDNNGNFDVYVTNSDFGNFLWKNQDGITFSNVAQESGVEMNRSGWGATWVDMNNNGWEDLYVNYFPMEEDEPAFFMNMSGSFTQEGELDGVDQNWYSFSSAKGDFNNDGKYDLAITRDNTISYLLLENTHQSADNWVKIRLQGQISNRDGIGTLIDYQINEQHFYKYTTAGTAYIAQDSQWVILGLGDATEIDELKLTWLSGQVDVYNHIPAGSVLTLLEGFEFLEITNSLNIEGDSLQICDYDQLFLTLDSDNTVLWSTGENMNSIQVSDSGWYYASSTNQLGIVNYSDSVFVEIYYPSQSNIEVHNITCFGSADGQIDLDQNESTDFLFENSIISDESVLSNLVAGEYEILTVQNGCTYTHVVNISEPAPVLFEYITTPISCADENNGAIDIVDIWGGTSSYDAYILNEAGLILGSSSTSNLHQGTYEILIQDSNGCEAFAFVEIQNPEPIEIQVEELNVPGWFEILVLGGCPPYWIEFNNEVIPNGYSVSSDQDWNTVIVSDANQCSEELTFQNNLPNALNSESKEDIFIKYSNGKLVFSKPVQTISILDLQGRTVFQSSNLISEVQLNFAAGIYIVKCSKEDGIFTKKIIFE